MSESKLRSIALRKCSTKKDLLASYNFELTYQTKIECHPKMSQNLAWFSRGLWIFEFYDGNLKSRQTLVSEFFFPKFRQNCLDLPLQNFYNIAKKRKSRFSPFSSRFPTEKSFITLTPRQKNLWLFDPILFSIRTLNYSVTVLVAKCHWTRPRRSLLPSFSETTKKCFSGPLIRKFRRTPSAKSGRKSLSPWSPAVLTFRTWLASEK